jgi:hypothetical protein
LLHSRYNPQVEAERYIDSLKLNSTLQCFILIEPGQGYMIPILKKKYENCKIIALHVDERFIEQDDNANIISFYSTDDAVIHEFLEKEIPEIDTSFIRIIEWHPSLNYYKDKYVKLLSVVVNFIKWADAERKTTDFFGRRWIKNFFKNLRNLKKIILYKTTDIPVIITGSGPSLETVLPVIAKLQDNCIIIAASSSVMALSYSGILPDIVIATDGGSWALRHIYQCFRNRKTKAVAVNLCAALPSQLKDTPHLIINDGSFWQNIVFHELSMPSVIITQKGTVTASAVELAMILSSGNIYLAGMDLSVSDIRTHVRPYGFDDIFFGIAGRFTPVYSQNFVRSTLLKKSGSMNIYASWFRNKLDLWAKRIFSLNNSNIFESSLPEKLSEKKNTEKIFKSVKINKDFALLYNKGVSALLKAIGEHDYAENLKSELAPLLFPKRNDVTENELKEAITEIAVYYGKGYYE